MAAVESSGLTNTRNTLSFITLKLAAYVDVLITLFINNRSSHFLFLSCSPGVTDRLDFLLK
jgi:hypothetical protein